MAEVLTREEAEGRKLPIEEVIRLEEVKNVRPVFALQETGFESRELYECACCEVDLSRERPYRVSSDSGVPLGDFEDPNEMVQFMALYDFIKDVTHDGEAKCSEMGVVQPEEVAEMAYGIMSDGAYH